MKGEGFSLLLTTEQDINALPAQIRARGDVLASEPADVFGARAFRLRDPDGFRLAISPPRGTNEALKLPSMQGCPAPPHTSS